MVLAVVPGSEQRLATPEWLRGIALNMASVLTTKQKPNQTKGKPSWLAKQNPKAPKALGPSKGPPDTLAAEKSAAKGGKGPKAGKPEGECPPTAPAGVESQTTPVNRAYNKVWEQYWAVAGLEVDKRAGAENKRRDAIAEKVPSGGCLLLSFLALARDTKTLEWVEGLIRSKGQKLVLPISKDQAVVLIERFCILEGVQVSVYEARDDGKGYIKRKYIQDFGCGHSRAVTFLRVPTIFPDPKGVIVCGHHMLPVRKLDFEKPIPSEWLFKDLGPTYGTTNPSGQGSSTAKPASCPNEDTCSSSTAVCAEPAAVVPPVYSTGQAQAIIAMGLGQESNPEEIGVSSAGLMCVAEVPAPEVNRRVADDKSCENREADTEMLEAWVDLMSMEEIAKRNLVVAEYRRAKRDRRRERESLRGYNDRRSLLKGELVGLPDLDFYRSLSVHRRDMHELTLKAIGPISCPNYPKFEHRPVYDGFWEPGCSVRWRSGWSAVCKPTVTHRFAALFQAPHLCSATLEQASKWLDQCWYVPYTGGPLFAHGSGHLIGNGQRAEKFEEGDVLRLHGRRYCVRAKWWAMSNVEVSRVGWEHDDLSGHLIAKKLYSLELAEEGLFAGCSDGILESTHLRWLVARCDPQATVERPTPTFPTEEVDMKVGYGLMLMRAPNSAQPLATVVRNDAAMRRWKRGDGATAPHMAERTIAALVQASDEDGWGYSGGQKYDWGYCYSCGSNPPGKFPGRLCKNHACVNGTKAARMATYGYQVVKPGSIVYPGVIQNVGQFPPLKSTVETMATPKTLSGIPLDKEALRSMPMDEQPAARLGGIGFGGAIPFSYAKGPGILGAALAYRAFRDVDVSVDPLVFPKISQFNWLLMPGFCLPKQEWELDYWLGSMPARRRKPLRQAHERRVHRGEDHKDYELFSPFVKDEHALYGGVLEGMVTSEVLEAIPRTIFAPHDETHLDAGRYLKPLVGDLKDVWHSENWLFYASCKPETLDGWLNQAGVKGARSYFCSDYSAFERSHSHHSWDYMEGIYRQIYPHADPQFWKALKAWRVPKGKKKMPKFDTVVEFKAECMNASGRDDTGLSNAILNGMALAFSFSAALSGKTVLEVGVDEIRRASELVKIAVMGDDSLVACSFDVEPYRDVVLRELKRFGFVVKAVVTPNLHDVTFLGMMPYPVNGRFYWGPTIGRRMYKAFWQHDPKGNLPAWTHGAAQQLALNACVPIVSDCAERVRELLKGKKATKIAPENEGYGSAWTLRTSATPKYDDTTLQWLCLRYPGLELPAIRRDLKTISQVSRLPALIRLTTTDIAFSLDEM